MARTLAGSFYADNYLTPPPSGATGAIQAAPIKFTIQANNPTDGIFIVGDKLYLVQLGSGGSPGFCLLAIRLHIPDLDSSTGLVFQLGDSTAADRYMTTTLAAALGQTAGAISSFGPSIPYASATAAAGVVAGSLPAVYTPRPNPNSNNRPDGDNLILTVQTVNTAMPTLPLVISGFILYSQIGANPFVAI